MKIKLPQLGCINIRLAILIAIVGITNPIVYAQFPTLGTASSVTITTPTVVGQSVTSAPVQYGQYINLPNLVSGSTYQIETCNLTTDDVQLYIFGSFSSSVFAISQNDDGCNFQSKILFTPSTTQSYKCAPYKYYNDTSTGTTAIKITLVNNAAPLTATMSATKPCFGANRVLVTVHAIGGTPPYTYEWSNGPLTINFIDLPSTISKVYSATITDAANHTTTASVTVEGIYKNTVTQTSGQLMADQAGASYTWLDCNNANQPIAGATAQSFTPTSSGSYAVRVSLNGCVDTSSCINMTVTGIRDKSSVNSYQIYPNPAYNFIQITSPEIITSLSISDISGKEIYYQDNNTYKVDISQLTEGIYLLKLNFKIGTSSIEKIIKQ